MSNTNNHTLEGESLTEDDSEYSAQYFSTDEEYFSTDEEYFSTDEEPFSSDENSEYASKNGDTSDDWNSDLSGSNWTTDADVWPQLGGPNIWEDQSSFEWGENEVQVNWDLENAEAIEPERVRPEEGIMIDTLEKLDAFLPILSQLKDGVELALDCEGTPEEDEEGVAIPGGGFGRDGNLSFLSMTIISMNKTYIFDVWELKSTTFERESKDGLSLKKVLESHDRIQLWWDVRSDWDTLFHKFGIQIGKVRDVQLMEFLSRNNGKEYVYGLSRAMEEEGHFMCPDELDAWLWGKSEGSKHFKRNGWRPLTARPIDETTRSYIAGDTECLFQLHNRLQNRLHYWVYLRQGKTVGGLMELIGKPSTLLATMEDLMDFIDRESTRRAHDAVSPEFDSKSPVGKAIPPAAFLRIVRDWESDMDRVTKRAAEDRRLR